MALRGRGWIYARVSGRAQATDGTSLDGQEGAGRRHLDAIGCTSPEVRVEVESAGEEKIERRVVLHGLVREAVAGDLVVVASLDRWSRDLVWGLQSIRALIDRGVGFFAIREALDAATPAGRERLGLLLWVAESERGRIRDRTVGRAEELLRKGLWARGSVPWGYRRGDRAQRKHLLLEADEHAPHVLEAHERIAGGASLRDVAGFTAAHGGPRHASSLHRIVRGRMYLGELWIGTGAHHDRRRNKGEWVPGQHPALITPDLWRRVQEGLKGRQDGAGPWRAGGETSAGLLFVHGLLRCGLCSRACEVGRVARPGGAYRYYVCTRRRRPEPEDPRPGRCSGPYVRAEPLDELAEDAVLARLAELRELLAARPGGDQEGAARGGGRAGSAAQGGDQEDFAAARRRLDARRARAVALAVDEKITPTELAAQRARLDAEEAKLVARESAAARTERAADPKARGDLRRAIADLRRTWKKSTIDERRAHLRDLAAKVELLPDKSLRWTWRSIEDLLVED